MVLEVSEHKKKISWHSLSVRQTCLCIPAQHHVIPFLDEFASPKHFSDSISQWNIEKVFLDCQRCYHTLEIVPILFDFYSRRRCATFANEGKLIYFVERLASCLYNPYMSSKFVFTYWKCTSTILQFNSPFQYLLSYSFFV